MPFDDLNEMPGRTPPFLPAGKANPPAAGGGGGSVFRQILAGALAGLTSGGGSAEDTGEALAVGAQSYYNLRERRMKNELLMRQDAHEEARLGLEQQRVGLEQERVEIDRQNSQSLRTLHEAQAAKALTDKLHIEKMIEMLPVEQQRQATEAFSRAADAYTRAGMPVRAELEDTLEAREGFLQQMSAQGQKATDFIFAPHPEKGRILVLQRDNTRTMTKEVSEALHKDLGIKIPVGTPMSIADNIITSTIGQQTALKVAAEAYRRQIEVARMRLVRMPASLVKEVARYDTLEGQLKVINNLFQHNQQLVQKGEESSWVGGVLAGGGAIKGSVKETTGFISPREAAFRKMLGRDFAENAHELYGAAFTGTELQMALKALPNDKMSPKEFTAAVESSMFHIQKARQNIINRHLQSLTPELMTGDPNQLFDSIMGGGAPQK